MLFLSLRHTYPLQELRVAKRNIVVIGGSSGSFEVFKRIVRGLPKDLDASIFIVWHMAPNVRGVLPRVLNDHGPLSAVEARDGEAIERSRIYVARPDHHLVIDDGHVRVSRGPKENRFRPAVDPLFRSAAYSYGPRVIGVVTSGSLDDGSSGLWEIKKRGGVAIVQDPREAETPSMPENAIEAVGPEHIVRSDEIAKWIVRLSQEDVHEEVNVGSADDELTKGEIRIATEDNALLQGVFQKGELTPYTCPECSGVLTKLKEGNRIRFRCHTGHAFSADSLLTALTQNIEDSLWSAIRGVDESILLLNHLGDHFAEVNNGKVAARFFQKAQEALARNERIRRIVLDHELLSADMIREESSDLPTNGSEVESLPAAG